jgi:anti-sigma regulatory factor (Ser/Thr protein kinase)
MTGAAAAAGFVHEALFYRDDDDFLATALPFLRDGLAADEMVAVLEPRPRLEMVRDALGDDAAGVAFADVAEAGLNPGRLIPLIADALGEATASGRRLRALGEPVFARRRAPELVECEVHEALVNVAFRPAAPARLLCAYDRALPPAVQAAALRTHPWVRSAEGGGPNQAYSPAADGVDLATLPACTPLPPPTDVVLRGEFGMRDVPAVRRTVRQYARSCALPVEQVESLELAASELASNCIRHGGGGGSLALWRGPDAVVVEFSCPGRLEDPLTGRRRPRPDGDGGMGMYLVHQLCDLVQTRTGPQGTVVRLSTWA